MMEPVTRLHMEVCRVLCDVETHGIKIDTDKLSVIEKQFKEEYKQLEADLDRIVKNLCGDTPINLASAEDKSKFFYSVVVKDKKRWKNIFDLGTELRDGKRRKRFVRTTTTRNFIMHYRPNVRPFMKTQQHNCGNCGGRGTVEYVRKDGTYGIPRKCKQCFGRGNIYHETKEVAGLGLRPENEKDLSVHGFKTDVNTIKSKLLQVTGVKREFLEK